MSTTMRLPRTLRGRLDALARRVRLLRAVRGVGLVFLVLVLTAGVALLADSWLVLPAGIRQVLFCVWLGLGLATLFRALIRPLRQRLDPAALAAAVEEKYPDLGERLTTVVELADEPGDDHGSPVLLGLLMRETEARADRLAFQPVASARRAAVPACAAALLVSVSLAAFLAWPRPCASLAERFFFPWSVPEEVIPYSLEVSPGDVIAARGRSVMLSVRLRPQADNVPLPTTCELIVTAADGGEKRLRMIAERSDTFSLALKVEGDGHYRAEAGKAVSATHALTAIPPVELATESPTITITPPVYARASIEEQVVHGLADLSALRHSQIAYDFRFTRPAVAAFLEWTAGEAKADGKPAIHPLALAEDRRGATVTWPATLPGAFRLVLEAERGIRTELDAGTLTIKPDLPPAFLKFSGPEELKAVLPYERLPLEIHLADDVGVARAEIEFQVNNGPVQREAIALNGAGTREAHGRQEFALAGKVKEGDEVRYRIRAEDNLPGEFGGPHVIFHPAERWLTLKVARQAEPLRQQEILAQRDDVNRRLAAIKADLLKEQRGVFKAQQEARHDPDQASEQVEQIKGLRKDNQSIEKALRELSREAETAAALGPVADRARTVADQEMRRADAALRDAASQKKATDRDRSLGQTDEELTAALKQLEELRQTNERLAQERLDRAKLEMLAERQKALAERAAAEVEKDPVRDPSTKPGTEPLRREQKEVADELRRLAEQSESLRGALNEARAEQTKDLAERARELAKAERDLAQTAEETERKRSVERFAELARKQQKLAEKAAALARETREPTRAAQIEPFQPETAKRAAETLKQGNAQEALKQQEQAAREMDRLANDLKKSADLARDPRQAARQLARLEESLLQRTDEAQKTDPATQPERLQPLEREQKALHAAVKSLSVPPNNPEAQRERQKALEQTEKAAAALSRQEMNLAKLRMDQARQALERLAERLPSLEQRQQQAREELARLRRQQEETARQVEKALRQTEKNDPEESKTRGDLARKQKETAERLSRMDAPHLEVAQEQVRQALEKAQADLKNAPPRAVAASQQEAQRALERLDQALRGQKSTREPVPGAEERRSAPSGLPSQEQSEQAQQLAREQRQLRDAVRRAAADARSEPAPRENPVGELAQQQEDVAREASELAREVSKTQGQQSPAGQQAGKAADQARQTANRMHAGSLPEARKTGEQTADSLRRLASQMAQTPRGPNEAPSSDPVSQARQLAQRQEELNRRLEPLTNQSDAARAQQMARQQDLQQQTGQLTEDLKRVAEQASRSPQAAQSAQQAARAGQQAQEAMRQAGEQARQGNQGPANQARQQAARALDRAAEMASQAGRQMNADRPAGPEQQAGRSVQQAQNQMDQAQTQLGQGQTRGAQGAMASAAQALQQAARQMQQAQQTDNRQPDQPGSQSAANGAAGGGIPDPSILGPEMQKYAGRPWGELPGDLRTRIVQDVKARYGDDYARMIKLYFEQIASTSPVKTMTPTSAAEAPRK
jgi:hypothetical protein